MLSDKFARDMLAAAISSIADRICIEHHGTLTQEHQLTARIGQALESELKDKEIEGLRLKIFTQDIPDKGRGALEGKIGSDLYINISVNIEDNIVSKGMLIQSKWSGRTTGKNKERLISQCTKLLGISDASYIWVYGKDGVRFVPAQRYCKPEPPAYFRGKPLGELFSKTLECVEGDRTIGILESTNARRHLKDLLVSKEIRYGMLIGATATDEYVTRSKQAARLL